jgi:hypothetical protein
MGLRGLEGMAETFQVGFDGLLQLRGFSELFVQFGHKAGHLFLEGFAIVFDFLGANVAARREHMAVRGDLGGGGGFAEAGDVVVFDNPLTLALSPKGARGLVLFVLSREGRGS